MASLQEIILGIMEKECYERYKVANIKDIIDNGTMCEVVFDGLYCWPFTKAGDVAVQPCSNNVLKSTNQGYATKKCTENGTWMIHDEYEIPWTNLTECGSYYIETFLPNDEVPDIDPIYAEWLPVIKKVTYLGYTISVIALLLSVTIFVKIKRLHCARNTLHVNLFMSFIMRTFTRILKDGLFVGGTALFFDVSYDEYGEPIFIREKNYSWLCKALVSIMFYFVLTNFNFILMEGVYLYNLMFSNFSSEQNKVMAYCVIGWGLPAFFIILWATLKIIYEDIYCWTMAENKLINLVIDVPIALSVLINFVLFLIIVRIITVKLKNILQQRKRKYRKLLKATLILIPTFGVPFTFSLLISFITNPVLEVVWLFFDQTIGSFQGLFASLLYCLLNSEVQTEVKRKYLSMKDRNDKEFRRSRTISNTQQFSLQVNDDENDANDKPHINGGVLHNGDNTCYF